MSTAFFEDLLARCGSCLDHAVSPRNISSQIVNVKKLLVEKKVG